MAIFIMAWSLHCPAMECPKSFESPISSEYALFVDKNTRPHLQQRRRSFVTQQDFIEAMATRGLDFVLEPETACVDMVEARHDSMREVNAWLELAQLHLGISIGFSLEKPTGGLDEELLMLPHSFASATVGRQVTDADLKAFLGRLLLRTAHAAVEANLKDYVRTSTTLSTYINKSDSAVYLSIGRQPTSAFKVVNEITFVGEKGSRIYTAASILAGSSPVTDKFPTTLDAQKFLSSVLHARLLLIAKALRPRVYLTSLENLQIPTTNHQEITKETNEEIAHLLAVLETYLIFETEEPQ